MIRYKQQFAVLQSAPLLMNNYNAALQAAAQLRSKFGKRVYVAKLMLKIE